MRTRAPSTTGLRVERRLHAPLHRLFAAWTEPDLLRQWWGPDDVTTHELVIEPTVGGRLRWTLSDSDGSRVTVRGEVFEIVSRERIAFTWMPEGRDWPEPSRVTVEFREARGVIVRIRHEGLPDRRSHQRHEKGWTRALDRFERLMNGDSPESPAARKPRQSFTLQQKAAPLRMRDGGQR